MSKPKRWMHECSECGDLTKLIDLEDGRCESCRADGWSPVMSKSRQYALRGYTDEEINDALINDAMNE